MQSNKLSRKNTTLSEQFYKPIEKSYNEIKSMPFNKYTTIIDYSYTILDCSFVYSQQ